jgi:hypothetical protein
MTVFSTKMTKDQCRDTGMAMVLLLLVARIGMHRDMFLFWAIGLQAISMTFPQVYKPVAVVWLGLSSLLGSVVSKVLMSVVFFGVVTPIGILRQLLGHDPLQLRAFKRGAESVMWERNHKVTASDIERPY